MKPSVSSRTSGPPISRVRELSGDKKSPRRFLARRGPARYNLRMSRRSSPSNRPGEHSHCSSGLSYMLTRLVRVLGPVNDFPVGLGVPDRPEYRFHHVLETVRNRRDDLGRSALPPVPGRHGRSLPLVVAWPLPGRRLLVPSVPGAYSR